MAVRAPERRPLVDPRRAHPAGKGRPKLRVVPPNSLSPHGRRRRARRLGLVLSVSVVAALLAVVALHALLSQGQIRLNQIDARATAEQARYERLRLQVAELESPARIVATAQQQLGMISPPVITYLSPSGAVADQPRPVAGLPAPATSRVAAGTTPSTWSAVKPYLADHP